VPSSTPALKGVATAEEDGTAVADAAVDGAVDGAGGVDDTALGDTEVEPHPTTATRATVAKATNVGGSLNRFLIPCSSPIWTTLPQGTDCQQTAR
jgi:hypothetical protein